MWWLTDCPEHGVDICDIPFTFALCLSTFSSLSSPSTCLFSLPLTRLSMWPMSVGYCLCLVQTAEQKRSLVGFVGLLCCVSFPLPLAFFFLFCMVGWLFFFNCLVPNCCLVACQPKWIGDASPFLPFLSTARSPPISLAPTPTQLSILSVYVCTVLVWTLIELGVHYHINVHILPTCAYTSADEGGVVGQSIHLIFFMLPPLFIFPFFLLSFALSLSTHISPMN